MKRLVKESDIRKALYKIIKEDDSMSSAEKKKVKPRCVPENIIQLDEIVGDSEGFAKYSPGVSKRNRGVKERTIYCCNIKNGRW